MNADQGNVGISMETTFHQRVSLSISGSSSGGRLQLLHGLILSFIVERGKPDLLRRIGALPGNCPANSFFDGNWFSISKLLTNAGGRGNKLLLNLAREEKMLGRFLAREHHKVTFPAHFPRNLSCPLQLAEAFFFADVVNAAHCFFGCCRKGNRLAYVFSEPARCVPGGNIIREQDEGPVIIHPFQEIMKTMNVV